MIFSEAKSSSPDAPGSSGMPEPEPSNSFGYLVILLFRYGSLDESAKGYLPIFPLFIFVSFSSYFSTLPLAVYFADFNFPLATCFVQ